MLTKIDTDGEIAFNVFVDAEGNEVKEHISLEDYSLICSGSLLPHKEGYSWKSSSKTTRFYTETGELEDGQYGDFGDNYLVKLQGCDTPFIVSKGLIVDGVLEDTKAQEMINTGFSLDLWQ